MKALLGLTAASALLASLSSFACTEDDISLKARELAVNVHTLTASDPQKAQKIYREVRRMQPEERAEALPDECAAYEQRSLELEEVTAKVEDQGKANYY